MHKSIIILIAVTLVAKIGVSEARSHESSVLLWGTKEQSSCVDFYGLRCKDCKSVQLCMGDETEVTSYSCGDLNPNAPFCVDGACSSEPASDECRNDEPPVPASLKCSSVGVYPDVKNCSNYLLCSQAGSYAKLFECPVPLIYSSKQESCVSPANNSNHCTLLDCSQNPGRFQVYQNDRSVLAWCPPGGSYPILTRCPDKSNQEYDQGTLRCNTICHREGRFSDKLDCHKYYQCVKNNNSFVKIDGDCGPLAFNPSNGKCEYSDNCGSGDVSTTTTTTSTPISEETWSPIQTTEPSWNWARWG